MRNNNKVVPSFTKSLKRSYAFFERHTPTLGSLVVMIFKGLMKPLIAAKAAIYRNPSIQPALRQIPWIPLSLVILAGTVLMYKDLNFNINLSAPTGGSVGGSSVAQPVSQPGVAGLFSDEQDQKNRAYILKYTALAKSEMEAYGIPASIKLAQGLLESKAGESAAATLNNNHFGIKCHSQKCRQGHCSNLEDMGHKAFFRKYTSAWDGWRAHSLLLTTGKYRTLTEHKDYQSWANGLEQLGYHSAHDYAKKLIQLIQYYDLEQLDR